MKLLMCFLMIFMPVNAAQQNAWVVASSCTIYETANFDSPLMSEEEPVTLSHGDKVEVLETSNDFVKIKFNEFEGYVYRYYLTFDDISQETYPVFNGSVLVESIIYDLDRHETELTAKAGQQIYIYDGFKAKEEFTAVALVLDDGKVYYGYLKTADIQPYGVNGALITGIMVVVSCLTIIFLLLFIRKKKGSKS